MHKKKRLTDAYKFMGFIPSKTVTGFFGDPKARIIQLHRRQKKQFVPFVVGHQWRITITKNAWCETFRVAILVSISTWMYAVCIAAVAKR
jgi:hypothetical protein